MPPMDLSSDQRAFADEYNDKPKLPYSDHLAAHFTYGYPPRPMVEPMHQGHWSTLDEYVDLETVL